MRQAHAGSTVLLVEVRAELSLVCDRDGNYAKAADCFALSVCTIVFRADELCCRCQEYAARLRSLLGTDVVDPPVCLTSEPNRTTPLY